MSTIREPVFNWLINASVQLGLFAILAALLSPFIGKTKAKIQHCFYLAIFALCLAAPVFNTLWRTHPRTVAKRSQQQRIQGTEQSDHYFRLWNGLSTAHQSIILVPGAKTTLDDDGELSRADTSENSAPSPITKTKLEGNALHVTVMDENQPFEFIVILKNATHAEIRPIGAPPNMKPIQAERIN
jgi:hypothetical protein